MNYKNPLTQYKLYPDSQFDPAFAEDVDLKFLPNFGVGAYLYDENYYISLSFPKLIKNNFQANRNNYSTLAEMRSVYFYTGFYRRFITLNNLVVKPTLLVKATWNTPVQFDLSLNFLFYDRFWIGAMYRSGDAICAVSQWIFNNNMRIGFAMDVSYTDIFPYQYGTYEFTLGFDIDFYGRTYIRPKFF